MLAAQAGQCRRIALRLRRDLRCRGQARGDGEANAVDEIAPRNRHLAHLSMVLRAIIGSAKGRALRIELRSRRPAASSFFGRYLDATILPVPLTWLSSLVQPFVGSSP